MGPQYPTVGYVHSNIAAGLFTAAASPWSQSLRSNRVDLGSRSQGSHHLCTKGTTSASGHFSTGDTFSLPFLHDEGGEVLPQALQR